MSEKNKSMVRGVLLLLILCAFISLASAQDYSKYQWGAGISGRLGPGETLSYMDYSVEAVSFPEPLESEKYTDLPTEAVEPFAILNISKNGIFLNTTVLTIGESFIVPAGDLKITVLDLPSKLSPEWLYESYTPWVMVEMSPRGIPAPDVSIESDQNEYVSSPSTEIVTTLTIGNSGTADIVNLDVILETDLQVKRGNLKYHYDRVKKGEVITNPIVFYTPVITALRSYSISAKLNGTDVKNIHYSANFLKTISVTPEPFILPTLRKSSNPKIYLKDTAMVSLSFKNNDKYPLKNVSIKDSIPENFKLVGNSSLNWTVSVDAYGYWDAYYFIKPFVPFPDGTVLPSADAEFRLRGEYYTVNSEQPEIVVNGPLIVLNKQVDSSEIDPNEIVTVTVSTINSGNTPTKVRVSDELPQGATLISGNTAREEYLLANKELRFSYSMRIDSVPVILPPAKAEYFELGTRGGKIRTNSQGVGINIKPKIVTPEPTPEVTVIVTEDTPAATEVTPPPPEVKPQVPLKPAPTQDIKKKPSPINPAEIDNFLNFMLGCNEKLDNITANACNFIQNNK